jgi:hypothetical protein
VGDPVKIETEMVSIPVQQSHLKESNQAGTNEQPGDSFRQLENKLMKYMLMFWGNQSQAPQYTPEERSAAVQAWYALRAEMQAAGVYVDNYGFSPDTDVTTVRVRNGKTVTTNGPFAETPERLSGYFMLDCKDLDEAIGWAAKIPYAAYGSIEVRPAITYAQEREKQVAGQDGRSISA